MNPYTYALLVSQWVMYDLLWLYWFLMFAVSSGKNAILICCLASECYSNHIRISIMFSIFIIKLSNNYFIFLIKIKCL